MNREPSASSELQRFKDVARTIVDALRTSGLHVRFAEWELAPGD
jgi:hypothetical protein